MLQQLLEKLMERVWNEKDMTILDTLFHERVVIHSPLGTYYGIKALRHIFSSWQRAFPDLKISTHHSSIDQDKVFLHWEAKGTHLGKFKEIAPTHLSVEYAGVTVYRIESNQVVEYWAYIDMENLLNQIRPSELSTT